jgi:PBSX family phage terminase large subunit
MRTETKKPIFQFVPFSIKQKKLLTWWVDGSPVADRDGIIADGSIRSGKTLIMSLSYVLWAMSSFEFETFIMSGKTIASFRRNVLSKLKIVLMLRGYTVDEKRSDNLLIVSKGNIENYFYMFGGKDEASQDLIQGLTAAGVFFDEAALMPESFINQAVARCSVEGSKLWFNCNPDSPYHYFNTDWIQQLETKNLYRLHFDLDDNPSLSERVKERYKSMFSGIFYDRFILGLWVLAEGTIYSHFNKKNCCIKESDIKDIKFDAYYVGTDYGITNPMVYLLIGVKIINNVTHVYVLDEYYNTRNDGSKTDPVFLNDYIDFIEGYRITSNIIDPSATSLINLLRQNQINIRPASNSVIDGISNVSTFIKQSRLHIVEKNCPNLLKEFGSYVWDAKKTRLGIDEPVKEHDHALDALRYVINTLYPVKSSRAPVSVINI